MRYVIYGVNRVAKDFLYLFEQLEIVYFFDDTIRGNSFLNRPVYLFDCAVKKRDFDQIIVCDFQKKEKIQKLQNLGLIYQKDFVCEEDFFKELDDISVPTDKKIAIWGTGVVAKEFELYSKELDIDCYIDTFRSNHTFLGIRILEPMEIENWEEYFVIIAVNKDKMIKKNLQEYGMKEGIGYISYQKISGLPSSMLKRTIFDLSYYDLECNTMLNHLEIFSEGNTRCCCTTFVKQNLDNIFEKSSYDLWNSNLHKIMCLSTENRTYSFCDKNICPLFIKKKKKEGIFSDKEYKKMSEKPEVLALGHDSSCNLSCSTCRKEVYYVKGIELDFINKISEIIKSEYLGGCKFLILAGDGELFASEVYQKIYKDEKCNPPYIRILSNGTLFTPQKWEELSRGKTGKIMLTVSADAFYKETYEKIRKNGNFENLKRNLEFASQLRKRNELRYFRLNFVVQKENYLEMIPFVKWGEQLGVDEVFFTKILNWGTYTDEQFQDISMLEKDGITPKFELKKILEDPVIKNSSIVDLGTIQYAHKRDKTDIVENYYMWELEKRGGKIFDDTKEKNSFI